MSDSPLTPPALAPDEVLWHYNGREWETVSPFTPVEQFAIRALIRAELAAAGVVTETTLANVLPDIVQSVVTHMRAGLTP